MKRFLHNINYIFNLQIIIIYTYIMKIITLTIKLMIKLMIGLTLSNPRIGQRDKNDKR